jgi:hypothetical protein
VTTTLESELRAAFARTAADVPDDLSARLTGHDYRPRRVHRTRAVAIAASVALLAPATALAVSQANAGGGAAASAHHGSTKIELTAAVKSAVAAAAGDVLHVHSTFSGGMTGDRWVSADGSVLHIATYEPGGAKAEDIEYSYADGELTTTEVDYSAHEWSQNTVAWSNPPIDCGDTACASAAPGAVAKNLVEGGSLSAAGVDSLLSAGDFKRQPGTQVVDGVTAYEITETLGDTTSSLWIDQATNLPVRVVLPNDTAGRPVVASDLTWLDPTGANLALLQVVAPDGFTRVPSVDK